MTSNEDNGDMYNCLAVKLFFKQNRKPTVLYVCCFSGQEATCVNVDSTLNPSQDTNVTDSCMLAVNISAGQQVAGTSDKQLNCSNNADCLKRANKVLCGQNTKGNHDSDPIIKSKHAGKSKGIENTQDMCKSDYYKKANSSHNDHTEWPHSPGQSINARHQTTLLPLSDHSLSDESGYSHRVQSFSEELDDKGSFIKNKTEPDIDTEAFWHKIMSVRHGNQNSQRKAKDLTQPQRKHWLHKPKMEMKLERCGQFPKNTVQSAMISRERSFEQDKKFSRGHVEQKYTGPAATTATSNAGAQDARNTDRLLPTGVDHTLQHVYMDKPDFMTEDFVVSKGCAKQAFDAHLKKSLILCKDIHWSQPQMPSDKKTTADTSQKLQSRTEASGAMKADQGLKEDNGQTGLKQSSHREVAEAASLVFEEKLSSFLEVPTDVSIDLLSSQVSGLLNV